jgi:hypothetical protein
MVSFWWDRGALTPWQLVPLAFDTLERHQLWDSKLFTYFKNLRDAFGGDVAEIQRTAHGLHRMMNAGLLERVESCTWRNAHGMLSTAQDYRAGCAATSTTSRRRPSTSTPWSSPPTPAEALEARGRLPRPRPVLDRERHAAEGGAAPAGRLPRVRPGVPVGRRGRAPRLPLHGPHARLLPDGALRRGGRRGRWTIGRRRDGYVALWSWRPAEWRDHDPDEVFTNGLQERFELVAWGGPDNVWILEVGDAERWGASRRSATRSSRRRSRSPTTGGATTAGTSGSTSRTARRARACCGWIGGSARGRRTARGHGWLPAVRQPLHLGAVRRFGRAPRRRCRCVRPRPRRRDAPRRARSLTNARRACERHPARAPSVGCRRRRRTPSMGFRMRPRLAGSGSTRSSSRGQDAARRRRRRPRARREDRVTDRARRVLPTCRS